MDRAGQGEFGRFDELLRRAVLASPDPPRSAPTAELIRASYKSTSGKSLLVTGTLIFLLGVWFVALAGGDVGYLVLGIPAVAFGVLIVVAPSLPARRAARAVRDGVRVAGEVTEVSYRPPGDATTIDAINNGFATGRRRVEHPRGTFEERFETDASWAAQLRPGSRVLLLVDPIRARVLVDMGPTRMADRNDTF